MDSFALKRLVPTNATSLGMIRGGVCGFILCQILTTSFADLGKLPVVVLRPTGFMQLLPWLFYDLLLTPSGILTFKALMVFSLLAATCGWQASLTTKSSAVLFVIYEGLLRSFSHFNHDEMPAVYILIVLAFTPCADAFSLDARNQRRSAKQPGVLYGYPILLMQVLLSWSYFSSALLKLRVGGLSYFSTDNLPSLAILHSLDNLHDTHFRFAFWLPQLSKYTPLLLALAIAWELSFPLAIFFKRLRAPILLGGVVFHLGTLFFMNIFFPYHLAMYLVFVDWEQLRQRIRSRLSHAKHEREATTLSFGEQT
jgi:Vitamin K-dependent gamma-carboxylase